ncbi:Sel1 repeat protein [Beggiatoa alba B18LD]|uniref:Sel1 repeat protein n=1 Tax=Beggiatoa alba B18LD TaxID=395493 RepID=I3CDA7_9GAMM|nr:tetratricopeptide repeat protein [Beggiatoa alba]EIJ41600.1 Sel1 repeat protein [Beggiatoa alba B18LD]
MLLNSLKYLPLAMCCLSLYAQATESKENPQPPYIAYENREGLTFDTAKCVSVGQNVLVKDGFQRVNANSNGEILAAYRKTADYQFKALVSCLGRYGMLRVVIITDLSGQGSQKARNIAQSIIQGLGNNNSDKASIVSAEEASSAIQAPSINGASEYEKGNRFYEGSGAVQDFKQAAEWYKKAAEQGNSDAFFKLGTMYYYGYGVTQDFQQSYIWFSLAATSGRQDAAKARNEVMEKLSKQQITDGQKEAKKLYTQYVKK